MTHPDQWTPTAHAPADEPAPETTDDDQTLEEAAPEPPSWRRRLLKVALIAAAILAGLILYSLYAPGSTPSAIITPPLVKAKQACDPGGLGTRVADGNRTLIVNGVGGEDTTGVTIETEACILRELGVTSAVTQHMDSTRALDGRQTDSWDGYKAAWTYHPDDGLDVVIQKS